MLDKILKYLNNSFYKTCEGDTFTIMDNKIIVNGKYIVGQYIKIQGSLLNDGIYKVVNVADNEITIEGANTEEFVGVIYGLAIPKDIINLETKIKEYMATNKNNSIVSESFGNYSYTKGTNKNGNVATWKDVFAEDLKPYRKINDSTRGVEII